jgi:hypothetical protein
MNFGSVTPVNGIGKVVGSYDHIISIVSIVEGIECKLEAILDN